MTNQIWVRTLILALALPLAACGDLLDVDAPGRIADEDLNNRDAVEGLVTGMSYDFTQALNGINDFIALASGELWHGGSYNWSDIPRGIIPAEDVNGEWATLHQARWVAEQGLIRLKDILGETDFNQNTLVARAYLLAGLSNRMLGENLCETAIDGGGREAHTVHFDRAIEQFTEAIRIGQAAGSGANDIVTAAYGGRASAKAWLSDWAGAVQDASLVPAGFVYKALLDTDRLSNTLSYETHTRFEYTVYNTEWVDHPNDPRAPWLIVKLANGSVATGANGSTPMYQQKKYAALGEDIPVVKGTEMLILRAEAALRANNLAEAESLMNQARAANSLPPLPAQATIADAWQTLHVERGAITWLESRRLWDLRRWFAESGPAHHDFLADRDKCIPISEEELRTNVNLRG